MASPHDRAAKRIARKLGGRYNRRTSPDVVARGVQVEVKSTAEEIPEALRQLRGRRGDAFVALPKAEQKKGLKRLARRKTGLMDLNANIKKPSTRQK